MKLRLATLHTVCRIVKPAALAALVAALVAWPPSAAAHPADISYLRIKVDRARLELRFTFNLLTLTRFAPVDADGNAIITAAEVTAAEPALREYLNRHIQVLINDKPASLGAAAGCDCVWPASAETGVVAAEAADYPQRYVELRFAQTVKPVFEDFWLGFEIWEQTGPLGTIEATYEQEDLRLQVPFSMNEPDYLYDTGYAVEGIFQPAAAAPAANTEPASFAASITARMATPAGKRHAAWVVAGTLGLLGAILAWKRRTHRRQTLKH